MSLAVALCLQDGGVDHFFAGISTEKVEIKFANLKFGRVGFFLLLLLWVFLIASLPSQACLYLVLFLFRGNVSVSFQMKGFQ